MPAPALAAGGPKYGPMGGVGSSASTYANGEPIGGTYAINGATGAARFSNAPDSPHNHLGAGQTVALLTAQGMDAEPLFAAATAGGGKDVYVPCGNYRFDEPLPITAGQLGIHAAQAGCVHIHQNFTTGSAFAITGGTAGISGVVIDGIEVSTLVAKTAGASFHVDNGHGITFKNNISVNDYTGFELIGGSQQFTYHADDNEVINASNAAFLLNDDGNPNNQVKDVYLTLVVAFSCSSTKANLGRLQRQLNRFGWIEGRSDSS